MSLKIQPVHYAHIKDAIAAIPAASIDAHKQAVIASGKFKGLGMRMRWDILRMAGVSSAWICDNLYSYLNDDHIDSALRAIAKDLSLNLAA